MSLLKKCLVAVTATALVGMVGFDIAGNLVGGVLCGVVLGGVGTSTALNWRYLD